MDKILTIVVPTYNMEKYLSNCLDSFIYDKGTVDLEILIVNDGSKDRSLEIAKTYEEKYPNIFKVIDKENGGHGSTVNAGLKVATGKYFKVVDSDDWVDTNELKKLIFVLKNTDADCVCCNYEKVFEGTNKKSLVDCTVGYSEKTVNMKDVNDFRFHMAASTYKTNIIKNARLDEKCFYVDVEYNEFCASLCKTVLFKPLNIYRYRIGRVGQSVSLQGFYKHRGDHKKVIFKLIDNLKNNSLPIIQEDCIDMIKTHYVNYIGFYSFDKNCVKELVEFDNQLKKQNEQLYKNLGNFKRINSLRKSNFKNIKKLNYSYKFKRFIKKILGKG